MDQLLYDQRHMTGESDLKSYTEPFIIIDSDYVLPHDKGRGPRSGGYSQQEIRSSLSMISASIREEEMRCPGKTNYDAASKLQKTYSEMKAEDPTYSNMEIDPNMADKEKQFKQYRSNTPEEPGDYLLFGGRRGQLEPAICFDMSRFRVLDVTTKTSPDQIGDGLGKAGIRVYGHGATVRQQSLAMEFGAGEARPSTDKSPLLDPHSPLGAPETLTAYYNSQRANYDPSSINTDILNDMNATAGVTLPFFSAMTRDQRASGGVVSPMTSRCITITQNQAYLCDRKMSNYARRNQANREVEKNFAAVQHIPLNNQRRMPVKIIPYHFDSTLGNIVPPRVKTLAEIGIKRAVNDNWSNINNPPKTELYVMLRNLVGQHVRTNVLVRSGPVCFNCHLQVLQVYSDYFRFIKSSEQVLLVPPTYVTPSAFVMIYDWMIADLPILQRDGLVELYNAADYLQVRSLMNQCWACMDSDKVFNEDTAFMLYLEAKIFQIESIKSLMITRVHRFFLTVVATTDFAVMTKNEVCTLLSCNSIGVNTEIEVFFAAIRWLSYDWERRHMFVLDLMRCVRFALMPPWFLIALPKEDFGEDVRYVVENPQVLRMINSGMSVCRMINEKRISIDDCDEYDEFLKSVKIEAPMSRNFIIDDHCPYHTEKDDKHIGNVTYIDFLKYLHKLQNMPKAYWEAYRTEDDECVQYKVMQDKQRFLEAYREKLDLYQLRSFMD